MSFADKLRKKSYISVTNDCFGQQNVSPWRKVQKKDFVSDLRKIFCFFSRYETIEGCCDRVVST